jgi:cyclophilin family peptidyl-prolyl cis-trans isomerase
MAKRRRRYDEKKVHRHDKHLRRRHRRDEKNLEEDTTLTSERRGPRFTETKRRDIYVVVIALICIISIIGGYVFYNFYYDEYFNPKSNEEPKEIIKQNGNNNNNNNNGNNYYDVPPFTASNPGNPIAILEVQDYGVIVLELYQNRNVHITVDNFLDYVRRGFYDGLIFHRVIDGFMIQGGGFKPDMSQKQIPADKGPIPLEIDPALKHVDGALAMARTSDPNSATNQFFMNDGPQPSLEPGGVDQYGYAVFGQVIEGMEIVRAISAVETTSDNGFNDVPVNDVIINRIYEYTGS